jgi:hypothetical protein
VNDPAIMLILLAVSSLLFLATIGYLLLAYGTEPTSEG